LSVVNPATGKELATVPDIAAASLDDAVDAARKPFPAWRALPLARRKQALSEVLTEIDPPCRPAPCLAFRQGHHTGRRANVARIGFYKGSGFGVRHSGDIQGRSCDVRQAGRSVI
jgi:hypothetical protein